MVSHRSYKKCGIYHTDQIFWENVFCVFLCEKNFFHVWYDYFLIEMIDNIKIKNGESN